MPVPPSWTRDLLSGSLDEVAAKLKGNEAIQNLQSKATQLLGDLPATAARSLDRILRETRKGSDHLRRWARRHSSLSLSAINGSGVWLHESLAGAPLSPAQTDALVPADQMSGLTAITVGPRIEQRLQVALGKFVDSHCLVAHSFSGAIAAVGASVPHDAKLAMPRAAVFRVEGKLPLPELLTASGARVLEFGSTDGCSADDLAAATRTLAGDLYTVEVDCPHLLPHSIHMDTAKSILIAPLASLQPLPAPADQQIKSLSKELLAQHWLTIIPGNTFVGGPTCGLILGRPDTLQIVRQSPLWSVLQAGQGTLASLVVTLEGPSQQQLDPACLDSLLTTSEENLQNRCQRLATQLAGEPAIASCEILTESARLAPSLEAIIPSRQLRITYQDGSGPQRAIRMADESPALLTRPCDDAVVLDLRWIPPQFDNQLVALLIGKSSETE